MHDRAGHPSTRSRGRCAGGFVKRLALVSLATALAHGQAAAQATPPIRIGGLCDRTGSTKIIGGDLCPGVVDAIALVNRKGGVQGQKLEYIEHDTAYMVDRSVDGYEKLRQAGVVAVFNYGVPILYALSPRYMQDRIPALQPGTGRSDAIDGEAWPYIFPGTASYWSQAGAAMKYLKDNGAKKGTRVAFLYFDNPAGREGIPMLEAVANREGYVLRLFAVQPPGTEMEAQVREIVREFKAEWTIGSLFGRAPGVSIREMRSAGFPLERFVSFVYGAGEPDVEAAGWDAAQGYLGLQFTSVGREQPIVREIVAMMRDEGREVPKYVGSAYYNRGVLTGALIAEAVRLAIRNHGVPLTGDKVRRGFEAIRNFDLQGFAPPLSITPQDHEGGGYLRLYQVKGREWVPVSEWIRGYRDDEMRLVRDANKK